MHSGGTQSHSGGGGAEQLTPEIKMEKPGMSSLCMNAFTFLLLFMLQCTIVRSKLLHVQYLMEYIIRNHWPQTKSLPGPIGVSRKTSLEGAICKPCVLVIKCIFHFYRKKPQPVLGSDPDEVMHENQRSSLIPSRDLARWDRSRTSLLHSQWRYHSTHNAQKPISLQPQMMSDSTITLIATVAAIRSLPGP